MKIAEVLERKGSRVVTVWTTRPLRDVVAIFDERKIASVVVTDPDDAPRGIVTDRAVLHALALRGAAALNEPVTAAMQVPPPICQAQDPISKVLRRMTDDRVRHVVVMSQGRMVGLVSIGDLVKIKLDDADIEGRVLRERALGQMAFE